jgi:uncharacterized protein (DUF433 family)
MTEVSSSPNEHRRDVNNDRVDYLLERIVRNPEILVGKPTIRGTRISVELIMERLGYGSSVEEIIEDYPHVTAEDIEACQAYAKLYPVRARLKG